MGRVRKLYKNILFVSIIFLLVGSYFLISCRSTKKLTEATSIDEAYTIFNRYRDKYDFIEEHNFSFDSFSSKISIKAEGANLNGQIRMQKDSVIWLSLRMFIEVARIKITPDSVYFINQIQKEYFAGDYSFLEKYFSFKVDLRLLQSLFVGNDIPLYHKPKYVSYRNNSDSSLIMYQFQDRIISENPLVKANRQILNVGLLDGKLRSQMINISQGELNAIYSSHVTTSNGLFPTNQAYLIKDGMSEQMYGIEIKFEPPVFEQQQTFPFSIPKNATPISF